jgi:hypothetical protein
MSVQQPMDYVSHKHDRLFDKRIIQNNPSENYFEYLQNKITAKNNHIEYLNEQLDNQRTDLISYRVALVGLIAALGMTLYQWLVVCGGNAPL